MNYREALDYIEHIELSLGSDYSLREVTELSRRVGRPDRRVNIIHLAGTNGKGSVGTYLTNILVESDYMVGRYLSPTLLDYRERVQLLGKKDIIRNETSFLKGDIENREDRVCSLRDCFASEEEIADCLTILKKEADEMVKEGYHQPTAFEIETVMAFMLFEKWQVDVAVVECGLGGRLDATNFIEKPLMCIFTSISRDHMGILGDSLQEIAKEKYGIIKEDTLVVSGVQDSCIGMLNEICEDRNASQYLVDTSKLNVIDFELDHNRFQYSDSVENQSFALSFDNEKPEEYVLAQNGVYQSENAAIAITAAKVLATHGFVNISLSKIKEALSKSYWYGRFEVVSRKPFVVVDGAHNEEGARRLRESLEMYFPEENFCYIMGMYQDKEYEKVLDIMLPLAKSLYTIPTKGARSLPAEKLADTAKKVLSDLQKPTLSENQIHSCQSVSQAITEVQNIVKLNTTKQNISDDSQKMKRENMQDRIIIFGSLSFINEIYDYFNRRI